MFRDGYGGGICEHWDNFVRLMKEETQFYFKEKTCIQDIYCYNYLMPAPMTGLRVPCSWGLLRRGELKSGVNSQPTKPRHQLRWVVSPCTCLTPPLRWSDIDHGRGVERGSLEKAIQRSIVNPSARVLHYEASN